MTTRITDWIPICRVLDWVQAFDKKHGKQPEVYYLSAEEKLTFDKLAPKALDNIKGKWSVVDHAEFLRNEYLNGI